MKEEAPHGEQAAQPAHVMTRQADQEKSLRRDLAAEGRPRPDWPEDPGDLWSWFLTMAVRAASMRSQSGTSDQSAGEERRPESDPSRPRELGHGTRGLK